MKNRFLGFAAIGLLSIAGNVHAWFNVQANVQVRPDLVHVSVQNTTPNTMVCQGVIYAMDNRGSNESIPLNIYGGSVVTIPPYDSYFRTLYAKSLAYQHGVYLVNAWAEVQCRF
jgi:hypothetical protein